MRELIDDDGIRAIAVAGYSLGGNLALKLAGELGEHAPPELQAVCAVSPTMDLARVRGGARAEVEHRLSVQLRAQPARRACAARRRRFPEPSTSTPLRRVWTVRAVRRGLHRAAPRLPRRRRLLPSRQRAARHRSDRRAGADPHGRGRPVRADRPVPRSRGRRPIRTSRSMVTPHGGHCAFVETRTRPTTTATGPSARSSASYRLPQAAPSAAGRTPVPSPTPRA